MMRAYYDREAAPALARRVSGTIQARTIQVVTMRKTLIILLTAFTLLSASGCVFRASISQGNIVEQEDLDQLAVGMTQNQVRFLLGTPMIDDPFHANRWDYIYYLKVGRDRTTAKRWVSVLFDESGLVSEIRKDQELAPEL